MLKFSRKVIGAALMAAVLFALPVAFLAAQQDTAHHVILDTTTKATSGGLIHLPGALASLVGMLVLVAAPAVSAKLWELFQKGSVWLNSLNPVIKQLVSVVLTWLGIQFFGLIHMVPLPGFSDITQLTQNDILQIASVGLAFIFKGNANQSAIRQQLAGMPVTAAAPITPKP